MEALKKISERILQNTTVSFKRYLYHEIDYGSRLIVIKGSRGVGKTTLMLQHIKELKSPFQSIYLSLDHILFQENRLINVVDDLYEKGVRTFALDEVHKYENWSLETKNIYDSYPDVKLILTASSALDIMTGMADLSRRADVYVLQGLSFLSLIHI